MTDLEQAKQAREAIERIINAFNSGGLEGKEAVRRGMVILQEALAHHGDRMEPELAEKMKGLIKIGMVYTGDAN